MKIVVCGKGGCGKSTIVSFLAGQYARDGHRVLVVDTDESNARLNRILGMGAPKDLLGYFGGKKDVMEGFRKSREEKSENSICNWAIDEIPEGYISKKGNMNLVAIGKIHEAGEGCACPMGVLSKKFISGLNVFKNDIVIIDTEAGIEHFGRGIDGICDVIIMVIDPSYESLRLSDEVSRLSKKIDVPLYYILNKTDENTSAYLRRSVKEKDRIIAEFPQDSKILSAGLIGEEYKGSISGVSDISEKLSSSVA
ncbi:MAG: ATP-binding protein [Methanomicrobiaceae archaeon]|nr:ATP-binding protein [Methanomicrobiaceae archaeon]